MPGMIAIRRVADAVLERVAEHAAPAGVGAVDPELVVLVLDEFVEIEIGDAGLDEGVSELRVDLDAAHALEIEDDGGVEAGSSAAIGIVPPHGDSPKRNPAALGDAQNHLDLIDARRQHHARRLVVGGQAGRVGVGIGCEPVGARNHPLLADDGGEVLERALELCRGKPGR